jgi:hypothetical protein
VGRDLSKSPLCAVEWNRGGEPTATLAYSRPKSLHAGYCEKAYKAQEVNQGVEQTPSVIPSGVGVLAAEREEGDREMVLWRPSRHGVMSGQGRLRILQM